jgi:AcrR family transcriptional regulator
MTSSPDSKAGGLRERKKARTKHAIQNHALRLFREQGFAETTVEQVAEAAEVSPSTVFRYFATKEELVVFDAFDPVIFAAFAEQPPERTLVQAWRGAVLESIARMSPDDARHQLDRGRLLLSVPELWGASLHDLKASFGIMLNLSAERTGLPPTDPKLRATVGAIVGAMLTVAMDWVNEPTPEVFAGLEQSLTYLDEGLVR